MAPTAYNLPSPAAAGSALLGRAGGRHRGEQARKAGAGGAPFLAAVSRLPIAPGHPTADQEVKSLEPKWVNIEKFHYLVTGNPVLAKSMFSKLQVFFSVRVKGPMGPMGPISHMWVPWGPWGPYPKYV